MHTGLLLAQGLRTRYESGFSAPKIHALQEKRFRSILRYAYAHSRFYRRHYDAAGLKESDLAAVPIRDIPPVSKDLLLENMEDIFTDPAIDEKTLRAFLERKDNLDDLYRGRFCAFHSSGTSGRFGIAVYDPWAWAYIRALIIQRVSRPRIRFGRKSRLAFVGATDGHFPGVSLVRGAPSLFYDVLLCTVHQPLKDLCTHLTKFQPDQLSGYALSINLLADEQRRGNLKITPSRIICSGELLSQKARRNITEVFGIEPVNFYGCLEAIGVGVDTDGSGMTMFDEANRLEILHADGTPVRPGEAGDTFLTNLYNRTQPLIRYALKDRLRLHPVQDGARTRIQNIEGRDVECLWFNTNTGDRDCIHPSTLVEFHVPGMRRFQFVWSENALTLRLVAEKADDTLHDHALFALRALLEKKNMEHSVHMSIEFTEEITPDPCTGKYRVIVRKEGNST